MVKKIMAGVVTGGILINVLGGTINVGAYSGETFYPENEKVGLVPTAIDTRNSRISAVFGFERDFGQVFKGLKFFEGEIDDDLLNLVYPGEDHGVFEYLTYDHETEGWKDIPTGEEFTLKTEEPLEDNTAGTLGFTYLFWSDAYSQAMNMYRGRINYSRCINSIAFQENEEAICRAELWEDGKLHYQPYIDWERLTLDDDTTNDFVSVYKEHAWTEKRIRGEDETETEVAKGDNDVAEEENKVDDKKGNGDDDGDGGQKNKNIEVPVEKETIKEVPVEKRVVEIKEVVREVPMFANMLEDDPTFGIEPALETESDLDDVKNNDTDDNEAEVEEDAELMQPDNIELPELGREDDSREWASKSTIFLAGLISAAALLIFVIVFRKKQQQQDS